MKPDSIEKLRQTRRSPELEAAIRRLSPQEREEIRQALTVIEDALLESLPIAQAAAIIIGVIAEALREIPSLVEEGGFGDEDVEEIEKETYAHCLEVMKGAVPSRRDLDPIFDLAATLIAAYVKHAVTSPSTALPVIVSPEASAMIATAASRFKDMKDSPLYEAFAEHHGDLEKVCKEWRRQGKPDTYWVTLQRLLDGLNPLDESVGKKTRGLACVFAYPCGRHCQREHHAGPRRVESVTRAVTVSQRWLSVWSPVTIDSAIPSTVQFRP